MAVSTSIPLPLDLTSASEAQPGAMSRGGDMDIDMDIDLGPVEDFTAMEAEAMKLVCESTVAFVALGTAGVEEAGGGESL